MPFILSRHVTTKDDDPTMPLTVTTLTTPPRYPNDFSPAEEDASTQSTLSALYKYHHWNRERNVRVPTETEEVEDRRDINREEVERDEEEMDDEDGEAEDAHDPMYPTRLRSVATAGIDDEDDAIMRLRMKQSPRSFLPTPISSPAPATHVGSHWRTRGRFALSQNRERQTPPPSSFSLPPISLPPCPYSHVDASRSTTTTTSVTTASVPEPPVISLVDFLSLFPPTSMQVSQDVTTNPFPRHGSQSQASLPPPPPLNDASRDSSRSDWESPWSSWTSHPYPPLNMNQRMTASQNASTQSLDTNETSFLQNVAIVASPTNPSLASSTTTVQASNLTSTLVTALLQQSQYGEVSREQSRPVRANSTLSSASTSSQAKPIQNQAANAATLAGIRVVPRPPIPLHHNHHDHLHPSIGVDERDATEDGRLSREDRCDPCSDQPVAREAFPWILDTQQRQDQSVKNEVVAITASTLDVTKRKPKMSATNVLPPMPRRFFPPDSEPGVGLRASPLARSSPPPDPSPRYHHHAALPRPSFHASSINAVTIPPQDPPESTDVVMSISSVVHDSSLRIQKSNSDTAISISSRPALSPLAQKLTPTVPISGEGNEAMPFVLFDCPDFFTRSSMSSTIQPAMHSNDVKFDPTPGILVEVPMPIAIPELPIPPGPADASLRKSSVTGDVASIVSKASSRRENGRYHEPSNNHVHFQETALIEVAAQCTGLSPHVKHVDNLLRPPLVPVGTERGRKAPIPILISEKLSAVLRDDLSSHRDESAPSRLRREDFRTRQRKQEMVYDHSQLLQVQRYRITDLFGDRGLYSGTLECRDHGKTPQPHGKGTMLYDDQRTYLGEWRHFCWHGQGRAIYSNGDRYIGEFDKDERHGKGRYEWHDGRIYDGDFHRGQRQGRGVYTWPDGSWYEGDFGAGGHRHGRGVYMFADGSVYRGEWQRSQYHGVGECVWSTGRSYQGEWYQGHAQGFGTETRPDGTIRHDGEWRMDRPVR